MCLTGVCSCIHTNSYKFIIFITKASCQAWLKLLIANEVRIGGLGGSPAERGSSPTIWGGHGGRICGQCTRWQLGDGGVRFPPGPCMDVHWGGQNRRKAMEELE